MGDSDLDEDAYERMMEGAVGQKVKTHIKKENVKISADDLLNSISTKKDLAETKLFHSKEKQKKKLGKSVTKTLAPPVHRIERDKVHGAVGYIELKKELKVWGPVVEEFRVSDHLAFPLNAVDMKKPNAAEMAATFKPKTELEIEMAKVLNTSKFNLKNDMEYTEAEREVIQSMNVEEAKAKLAQMQKMRALMSYKLSTDARKAKIKSKSYHRILKRQKRKQLLKEFDDLLSRDPEAAKEKLKEIEEQRVYERASLKHAKGNKFNKDIAKFAAKDKRAQALFQDHLRLGRELKEKVGAESDSDIESAEDETKEKKTIHELLKESAVDAAKAAEHESSLTPQELTIKKAEHRISLAKMREEKRKKLEQARLEGAGKVDLLAPEVNFEVENNWETVGDEKKNAKNVKEESQKPVLFSIESSIESDAGEPSISVNKKNIDEMFDAVQGELMGRAQRKAKYIKASETLEKEEDVKKKEKKSAQMKKTEVDISLDPKHFLQVETSNLAKVSDELVDRMDEFEEDKDMTMAAAFQDDDVMESFGEDKEELEEREKEHDMDLTLLGWGDWTGPGINDAAAKRKKERFIVKARAKKRRDNGLAGVIISEKAEEAITKFQPKTVPFPYTRMQDYEAAIKQPIGRDWNPTGAYASLIKPNVVTQAGRVIRAMNKSETIKRKFNA